MTMTPSGFERFSTLSGSQQQIFDQLSNLLQGRLGGADQTRFEAPIKRQFEEQIVPGLAERFSGLGAGSQSSSAFRQALGASGVDLSERLGQLGAQKEDAALQQLLQILGMSTEGLVPKQKSFLQQLLLGLSGGMGQGLGSLATGGLGKLLGGF